MYGITVTLAAQDTVYNLFDLLAAIDSSVGHCFREMMLQSDPDNGGARIRIGDTSLSGTRCGFVLKAGESRPYRSDANTMDPHAFSVMSDTDGSLLHVELYEL